MTADEMFREMGYEKVVENSVFVIYSKPGFISIEFDLRRREFVAIPAEFGSIPFNLAAAIAKLLEEMESDSTSCKE